MTLPDSETPLPADVLPRKLQPAYKLEKRIRRQFAAALRQFHLVSEGDHILIGLSGGKDSLALMTLLGDAARRSRGAFRVSALHVRMSNIDYESDTSYLEAEARKAGVELFVETGHFEPDRAAHRSPCFLCSWTRRKLMFAFAQKHGCNKIALGHHRDDILRTALMNLTFSGTFSTMPVRLAFRKMPLTLIRPLALTDEADLLDWAELSHYVPQKKRCPFDDASNRTHIGAATETLAKLNPEWRYSLWHALEKAGSLVDDGAEEEAL